MKRWLLYAFLGMAVAAVTSLIFTNYLRDKENIQENASVQRHSDPKPIPSIITNQSNEIKTNQGNASKTQEILVNFRPLANDLSLRDSAKDAFQLSDESFDELNAVIQKAQAEMEELELENLRLLNSDENGVLLHIPPIETGEAVETMLRQSASQIMGEDFAKVFFEKAKHAFELNSGNFGKHQRLIRIVPISENEKTLPDQNYHLQALIIPATSIHLDDTELTDPSLFAEKKYVALARSGGKFAEVPKRYSHLVVKNQ